MGFKLKSGNTTSFKTMGGTEKSPAKHFVDDVPDHNDGHSDDLQTPEEHEAAKSPDKAKKLFGEATIKGKESPAKHKSYETHFHDKEGKVDYRGYDKGDLFLRGKTKDKKGNIKDIKWAPNPKKSPAKHGKFKDFQYGRKGHNPDTMSAKHEDFHAKQSDESPAKQTAIGTGFGKMNPQDMIAAKIDEKVEEKVNKVVNQETGEGLV